jgi:hypothetical protein
MVENVLEQGEVLFHGVGSITRLTPGGKRGAASIPTTVERATIDVAADGGSRTDARGTSPPYTPAALPVEVPDASPLEGAPP